MLNIDGLSKEQVTLLKAIWKMDTLEEVQEWKQTLSSRKQKMVSVLQEMIVATYLDQMVDAGSSMGFKEAENVINKIKSM